VASKIIETKLVFKGDVDQATKNIIKLEQEMDRLVVKMKTVTDTPLIVTAGESGVSGRGGSRAIRGSPRSEHAPAEGSHMRGGTSYGGKTFFGWRMPGFLGYGLGAAGRAPGMAASVAGSAMGGGGTQQLGGFMQQIGGSMMGAFGGLGAIAGIPLLAAGAAVGLSHILTQPAINYYKSTTGLAGRMGRPAVQRMMGLGVESGISPMDFGQYLSQLEMTGAQAAFPAIAALKKTSLGFDPGMTTPFFGAIGRAGGGRTETEFDRMSKILAFMAKDIHSMPEFLGKMTTMTSLSEEHLAELGQQGSTDLLQIGKFLEGGGAWGRGQRGAQLYGKVSNWIASPGEPAKDMFLWSILNNDKTFRSKIQDIASPDESLGYIGFQRARGRPGAWFSVLGALSKMGPRGELAAEGMGVNPDTMHKLLSYYRNPEMTPAMIQDKISEYQSAGKLPTGPEEVGASIVKMAASMDKIKIELGEGLIKSTMETELELLEITRTLVKGIDLPKIMTALKDSVTQISETLGGKTDWSTLITNAVAAGMGLAISERGPIQTAKRGWETLMQSFNLKDILMDIAYVKRMHPGAMSLGERAARNDDFYTRVGQQLWAGRRSS
jgi:hypothetical protein